MNRTEQEINNFFSTNTNSIEVIADWLVAGIKLEKVFHKPWDLDVFSSIAIHYSAYENLDSLYQLLTKHQQKTLQDSVLYAVERFTKDPVDVPVLLVLVKLCYTWHIHKVIDAINKKYSVSNLNNAFKDNPDSFYAFCGYIRGIEIATESYRLVLEKLMNCKEFDIFTFPFFMEKLIRIYSDNWSVFFYRFRDKMELYLDTLVELEIKHSPFSDVDLIKQEVSNKVAKKVVKILSDSIGTLPNDVINSLVDYVNSSQNLLVPNLKTSGDSDIKAISSRLNKQEKLIKEFEPQKMFYLIAKDMIPIATSNETNHIILGPHSVPG